MTNADELSRLSYGTVLKRCFAFPTTHQQFQWIDVLDGRRLQQVCRAPPHDGPYTNDRCNEDSIDDQSKALLEAVEANFAHATDSHIEDYLSEIGDLLAITDRRAERGAY